MTATADENAGIKYVQQPPAHRSAPCRSPLQPFNMQGSVNALEAAASIAEANELKQRATNTSKSVATGATAGEAESGNTSVKAMQQNAPIGSAPNCSHQTATAAVAFSTGAAEQQATRALVIQDEAEQNMAISGVAAHQHGERAAGSALQRKLLSGSATVQQAENETASTSAPTASAQAGGLASRAMGERTHWLFDKQPSRKPARARRHGTKPRDPRFLQC